jgi:spermidine synthase
VPSYPSGLLGFVLCTTDDTDVRVAARAPSRDMQQAVTSRVLLTAVDTTLRAQLRFYTRDMHRAAFVLPAFAERQLNEHATAPRGAGHVR